MTEDYVHVAMRQYLKNEGWQLIAGEFPGGSDDELNVLSISDPAVARDNSPTPRQHSTGEIIPDLFAHKDGVILVVEAKPKYSVADREKLIDLFTTKRERMIAALEKFSTNKPEFLHIDFENAQFVPALAFNHSISTPRTADPGFAHIYVESLDKAAMIYFGQRGTEAI